MNEAKVIPFKAISQVPERPENTQLMRKRTYAFTMDLFFITLINRAIIFAYLNFLKTFFYQLPTATQISLESKLYQVQSMSLLVVFWGYFVASYYLSEGRTPGKTIFGLKVHGIHKSIDHLSLKDSFLRTLGYFSCMVSFLFLFSIPFFRKDNKGIPDWLSNTVVMTDEELEYIRSLETHATDNSQTLRFPEDPMSIKISKIKKKSA